MVEQTLRGEVMSDAFGQVLGIRAPWRVAQMEFLHDCGRVRVRVEHEAGEVGCPQCGRLCAVYDHREREWRHLDTCEYRTYVVAQVPRVRCPEHGVVTVRVPWAEVRSRFTVRFESLAIDWLRESSTASVERLLGLSWNAIDGIKQRAVARGLRRRGEFSGERICVDETSFRKRHDYVTVVSDHDRGVVEHVAEGRKKESLGGWYASLPPGCVERIESVSMDMWEAYVNATLEHVPDAESKIAFDRFHVARHLGDAVDRVRREEHRMLLGEGIDTLKGTKYDWLRDPASMSGNKKQEFRALRDSTLKTARAWAIKELANSLWRYRSRTWALKAWKRWLSWAMRCRLEPVKKAAKMIKKHLWGIINSIVLKVSNGPAESINSRIKTVKIKARGFRNKQRFVNDIYFHLGGLDLYPDGVS